MKAKKTGQKQPPIARWYAPDEKAMKRLIAAGAPKEKIYFGWTKTQHWEKVTMRDGEGLGVVDGFRAFGTTKRPVKQAVQRFHDQGATIIDVETGMDSCRHGVQMYEAITKPPRPSPEYLRQLQEEKREAWRIKNGVMPKEKAYIIWRNAAMSVPDKLDLMHGWTKDLAYREFGHTGRPAGRPLKKEK